MSDLPYDRLQSTPPFTFIALIHLVHGHFDTVKPEVVKRTVNAGVLLPASTLELYIESSFFDTQKTNQIQSALDLDIKVFINHSGVVYNISQTYFGKMEKGISPATTKNRLLIGEYDGIDVLLQQLASYKRNDPSNKEELEYMENLFDSMCSCLMRTENRAKFLRGEGLQLMNLMLREKKLSRNSAIKVLNHAMSGPEGADNSQKFVDILGLRTIFPLFMKTPKQAKAGPSSEELEEHITSIVASMMKNCQATQRQRLVNKYTENDHEKVERLLELHFKYLDKVRTVDDQIEREKQRMKNRGEEIEDDDEFYIRRLEAGLFTLQLVDYIMLEICATGPSSVKQRVMQILNMRGGSIKSIRSIMREYAGNIGDAKDPEAKEQEQDRILQLVDKF
ncbi:Hypothetical predicted protein [Mytilus galloprovincialis]|uniref:Beta-catenin-like protein 1 n=1 Tax=Mytilus galloprovincialis TaxID=29158 RepID=A0A8B6CG39_MYTGA|nr:Hypothetical predicted protein [Mytilus galloprovincialis]